LHRQPVSMSCVCQRLMEFLSGGSTSNCRRKLRWTVITDVVFAYSTAQNAFCCLVGAILNILCPRERRVFQSKLWVSSSNHCNLHHSPHTGHLEKKIKKGYNLFRTRCIHKAVWISHFFTPANPTPNMKLTSNQHYLFSVSEGKIVTI